MESDHFRRNLSKFRLDLELGAVAIYARNESKRILFRVAWEGDEAPAEKIPFGQGDLGRVAENGKAVVINRAYQGEHRYSSRFIAPVTDDKGQFLAVLFCASIKKGFFDEKSRLSAVKAFANYLTKHSQAFNLSP